MDQSEISEKLSKITNELIILFYDRIFRILYSLGIKILLKMQKFEDALENLKIMSKLTGFSPNVIF